MKKIVLLGATGSIGDSCLNVIRQNKDQFQLMAIALNGNLDKAQQIYDEFHPEYIYIAESNLDNRHSLFSSKAKILSDADGLQGLIEDTDTDIVISAISGFAGLEASYFAINAGKTILVANKESIVAAGDILMPLAQVKGSKIIPVDSEHNAIHQCLSGQLELAEISKILITASGGPFREKPFEELQKVTLEDALNHPTWNMGSKITIDSATLVNKCLELIEAHYLFDIPESHIDIVVHPQSIIHSMVTFVDGSTIAQMSNPNMEVPIANALGLESRLPIQFEELNFSKLNLTFEKIPDGREIVFDMAREVCNKRGNLGVIFNASNEIAVDAFINKKINFSDIYSVIERTFNNFPCSKITALEDIFDYDKQARIQAEKVIKSLH
ncbi:MAG: 1-deoxy-D-xylulose-5-phosphate reductoisomerase [Gammaproteobacteria bacterium]|jgi:1-deoxy-D-xylulose-5-phosphate reductoisomerase|nr:1-deoxy-D-xylulose-5-phosphate reductoisomerase [Gammaproteobacteria bacterium]|tara:strand:+ start:256 stop:1407 length:1152 start_codon:yes stop_codon:yes gene_type:complete